MVTTFFELALSCYFTAAILGIVELAVGKASVSRAMKVLIALGFVLHTVNVFLRYVVGGHMPIASMHEATSFLTWSIVLIFFIIELKYKISLLGSFVMPGVFILMLSSSVLPRQIKPIDPTLQSYWLWIHTTLAFLGDAAFAVACGIGVMYLVQERFVKSKKLGGLFHRLPSLQMLDDTNYRLLTIGFPLLTLAIITGAVWAEGVWGTFWRWDPKEVWSLITWLFYAMVLHVRTHSGWHGKKSAILSVIGFAAVLFTFFGVNLLLKSLHEF
ncbi:MAG: c-type cytochrome biogenesis protein CcsB [Nitrospirae bacterium]|nr:c-type cytochrome biogenesis protein CcsB [Nitrospirota bacterium]